MGILLLGAPSQVPFGKINLGLTAPSLQQNATPFINLWKGCNTNITYTQSGVGFRTDAPQGTTVFGLGSAFPLFADADCESISPLPAGTTLINRSIWQFSTPSGGDVVGQYPPQWAGQQFTIDWTGATDWTISVNDSVRGTVASGTSPFTFTWPTTYGFPTGANVIIYVNQSAGTLSNPPKNIRIYKTNFAVGGKTGAQRLAAGEVIDPDYAASLAAGCGTFRVMDWMATINNNVTNSYANIPTETNNNWGAGGPSGLRGMPVSVIVKTALATNKNPHITIPSLFMCQKYKDIQSITRATSPVVTTLGPHTWSNGDTVILNSTGVFVLINHVSYATSTFTSNAHGMVNGYPLMLGTTDGQHADGSTYPTGVSKAFPYYACNVTANTFQIASTQANALAGTNLTLSGSLRGPIITPAIKSITGGSLYTNGTYTNVPITGGSGTGMLATVVVSSAAVSSVSITNIGNNGYAVSDTLSCSAASIGGTGSGFSFNLFPENDGLGTITGGSGYTNGTYTVVSLTGGSGSGAQATVVVSGNAVTSVTITSSGNNLYINGDALSCLASSIGGTGSGFSVPITQTTFNLYLNMNLNRYTVSNTNPSGNTFQITGPGSDTTILTSGSLNGGFSMSPYDISYINTQVGLLAGYFRDNLPAPFCPTYEVDNEIWNFGTRVFFNFNGQARGKFSDSVNQVVGYMQGVFAQAVKTAYAGDRTRYKMVFGGNQMFGDLFGAGLQGGWNAYIADNPGVVATDLFDHLLGNTYFQTSYNNNGSAVACTFGTNTVTSSGALAGFPVKLATSGALPSGLTVGTLGTAAATRSSSLVMATISGNVLTVAANLSNGDSSGTILAGSTLALPGVIPVGTTIAAYGTGGTTGTGGSGTYQISNSLTVSALTVFYCGTPYVPGTGPIYWLVGTGPNFGLATTPGGSPVSFTGPGTGSHTLQRCPVDVVNFLMTQSLALNISTPATYPTPFTYYNQEITNDLYDARWTAGTGELGQGTHFKFCILSAIDSYNYYYNTYLAPGKLLAGLSQTSYEGGQNCPPQTAVSSTTAGFLLENDPTWQALYYNQNYCQGQADNMAQMDAGCRSVPNGFYKTSQFLDCNPFGVQAQSGIYGAKEYIGDNNLRWQGIVSVNNS